MKIKKVIEQLQHYVDNYGEDVEVDRSEARRVGKECREREV